IARCRARRDAGGGVRFHHGRGGLPLPLAGRGWGRGASWLTQMPEEISPSRPGFAGPTSPASGEGDGASGRLAQNIVYFAQAPAAAPEAPQAGAQRVQEALFAGMNDKRPPEEREIELDARLTMSDREVLQKKDFAQMSAAEIALAKDAIKRLVLSLDEVKTRRLGPHRRGHIIDMRRTLRASMKAGGALIDLKYLGAKTRQPPIVALLDISGRS